MKHFFLLATFFVTVTIANATIHNINCQNSPSHFLPVTINAVCGDTIHWTWVEGGHSRSNKGCGYTKGCGNVERIH